MPPPFFAALDRFGLRPALIDGETGETLDYTALEAQVADRAAALGDERKLVFVEARNDIASIVDYLACLRGKHAVHLTEDLSAPKIQDLVTHYAPHILIDGNRQIVRGRSGAIPLHADLALLLSTSGSTGSPKFVKLSARNIASNADAIADYLHLDDSERALQHLKPHYSYGLSIINSHLAVGAALVLTPQAVTDDAFWTTMCDHAATSFAGVPYTFETLKHRGFSPAQVPSLRYATQAGGKLEAQLVAHFAASFASAGRRFYVMYGQTEAAPRISYLPPDQAVDHPGSIGHAIPGGTLYLLNDKGDEITAEGVAGELAYEGPNVMMGYASTAGELANDDTPSRLLTGDVAERRDGGLFFIVGRSSRFVKPFGVRVNLDEVQSFVKLQYGACAVTGDDRRILIAVEGREDATAAIDVQRLVDRFGLPPHIFRVRSYAALPLLSSGKYDFRSMLSDDASVKPASWFGRIVDGIADILGLRQTSYSSVTELYRDMLSDESISAEDSFSRMAADSLSFVALAIEMESLFKENLPDNWQDMALKDLEAHYQRIVVGVAG